MDLIFLHTIIISNSNIYIYRMQKHNKIQREPPVYICITRSTQTATWFDIFVG
jgi:hypothetical protein